MVRPKSRVPVSSNRCIGLSIRRHDATRSWQVKTQACPNFVPPYIDRYVPKHRSVYVWSDVHDREEYWL
jgi:hypothetical protein